MTIEVGSSDFQATFFVFLSLIIQHLFFLTKILIFWYIYFTARLNRISIIFFILVIIRPIFIVCGSYDLARMIPIVFLFLFAEVINLFFQIVRDCRFIFKCFSYCYSNLR